MKKSVLRILLLTLIFTGCSTNDSASKEYFNFSVGGIDFSLVPNGESDSFNRAQVLRNGDLFVIIIVMGFTSDSLEQNFYKIYFDKNGNVIYAERKADSSSAGGLSLTFKNYPDFSSNYFTINILSINESSKKIRLNFSGNLYYHESNLNSESVLIEGDLDMTYNENQELNYDIKFNGIDQYCSAKLNSLPWKAWQEYTFSQFTSTDAYKIEPHFASDSNVGSYNFNATSTDNYVRFSKFNTSTLTYDYYIVTGQVAYSYKEFHGGNMYSFIGTFNFTATNPNNPSDVIQVTDGVFRSYQQF